MAAVNKLISIFELFCTILLTVMSFVLFAEVFLRYLFHESLFWAEELARYSMVWLVYIGAVIAVFYGSHTRVDFFVNLMPRKLKIWTELFKNLLCAAFMGGIAYYGVGIFKVAMMSKAAGLRIPMGYVYGILPITAMAMTILFIIQAFQIIGKTAKD